MSSSKKNDQNDQDEQKDKEKSGKKRKQVNLRIKINLFESILNSAFMNFLQSYNTGNFVFEKIKR